MARDTSPGVVNFWTGTNSGYSYAKLESKDWDDRSEASSIAPPKLSWRTRFLTVRVGGLSLKILLGLAAGMAMLILLASASTCDAIKMEWTPEPPLPTKLPALSPASNSDPSDLRLRVILPADNGGPNLCKTVLSGYANGYPAPLIVNWGRDFNKDSSSFGLSHLGKIDGTLELLETLLSDTAPASERLTDDDIIVVMDAYDVWLQLPPSILISRFHAQNALANARLAASWTPPGNDTSAPPAPTQSIVISTQKKCWPKRSSGAPMRCDAMPPSTARRDLYGRMTDAGSPHDARPRHVNSGSVVGTARAMLHMFRRVQGKVLEGRVADGNSDQGVFAEVLAEQELWRARARSGDAAGRDEFEYGIGLDHVQDLMPPTVFAEQDGAFMRLDDGDALAAASFAHGVYPARLQGVPADVGALEAPGRYAGVGGNGTWAEVPLYADYWTAKVPVAVHHNAHRGGLKKTRLRDWWALTWFFPHLRRVAEEVRPRKRVAPLATIQGEREALVYWPAPSDAEKPLPRTFDKGRMGRHGLEEVGWDVLCPAEGHEAWWDEVFQDGKGPLGY